MVLISCYYWLSVNKKFKKLNLSLNNQLILITTSAIFFILFVFSLLSIYFNPIPNERPLIYFILISAISTVLFLGILYSPKSSSNNCLLLSQVILFGMLLTYSQLFVVPSIVGVDPWYHEMFTQMIINKGHIPTGDLYSNLPIFHLLVSNISIFTNLDYKLASALSISFLQIFLDVIALFLIGKLLFNNAKIGLLAGLLLVISNVHLAMGFAPIPNTLGLPLFLLMLFLIFRDKGIDTKFLVLFLMLIVIMTHSISALVISSILFLAVFVYWIYNRFYSANVNKTIQFNMAIFFLVLMIGWWLYASGNIEDLVKAFQWGFSLDMAISKPELYSININKIPIIENILTNVGMFLFFSLSLIGSFVMISKHCRNSKRFYWSVIGFFLLGVSFLATATGSFIYTGRWSYFAYAILSIPLSISFLTIVSIHPKTFSRLKTAIVLILIFCLTFFMVISPVANKDNNQLFPNTLIKTSVSTSEFDAIETLTPYSKGYIGSDAYFAYTVIRNLGYKSTSIDSQIYNKNFTDNNTKNMLLLIRGRMFTENIDVYGPFKLDYDINSMLNDQGFSEIYDSGTVYGYLK